MIRFFLLKIMIFLFCFFFGFFWSCDSSLYYDDYVEIDSVAVSVNSCTTSCKWDAFELTVHTEGKITRSTVVAQNQGGGAKCLASNVATRLMLLEKKIKNYQIFTVPHNTILTEDFISDDRRDFITYINDINEGLPPQKGNSIASPTEDGRMIYDSYRFPETFHFQEAPEELIDKDFQIVVWLKTEDGKEFSDTTEVVRLTL